MSEEESSEFFELSAPLQDALETINDHLMQEAMKTSLKMGEKSEKQQQEQQPKNNQLEWAYKVNMFLKFKKHVRMGVFLKNKLVLINIFTI